MGLLQSLRDRLSSKKPCYECNQPTSPKRLHRVQYNFHGTLSQHEVCDACREKMKRHKPSAAT